MRRFRHTEVIKSGHSGLSGIGYFCSALEKKDSGQAGMTGLRHLRTFYKAVSYNSVFLLASLIILFLGGLSCLASAATEESAGTVVAVRGRVIIDRDKKELEAKVKDPLVLRDIVSTLEASKVKLLFRDESVLTMGEKSRLVVTEFLHDKDKKGRSIFNLIDGKMRAIVGKTEFEVHTPTVVAAARGTIILFETGMLEGKLFTTVISLEGLVDIMSVDPKVLGSITLTPGTMVTVFQNAPLPSKPAPAAGAEIKRLQRDTGSVKDSDDSRKDLVKEAITKTETPLHPKIEQQPKGKTPVHINVIFPLK